MSKISTKRNFLLTKQKNLRSQNPYKIKSRVPKIYYYNNNSALKFLVNFILHSISKKVLSLFCTSQGEFFYCISTAHDSLWNFYLFKRYKLNRKKKFKSIWSFIYNLKKRLKISLLSLSLNDLKIRYVRAIGSFAKIYQINRRKKFSTIILPSKKRYNVSLLTIVSKSFVRKFSQKKRLNTYAGNLRKLGKKANSRGIAMNPIDHPHGGNTNSIAIKKTPWGLITVKNK